MYPDYHVAVWQAYQKMRAEGSLPPNLMNPTRAKLKDECLLAFNRRYEPNKDEFALKGYFARERDEDGIRKAIGKDADKFKRLEVILNSDTISKTGDPNIEMLAFLIDFQPRPGHRWDKKTAPVDPPPPGPAVKIKKKDGGALSGPIGDNAPRKHWKMGLQFEAILLALTTSAILYFSKPPIVNGRPRGKCMFWAEDHYTGGPCNILHRDTPVVQMDSFKLVNFKKISNWSTLSKNAIGNVWYAKINQQVELFTTDGFHPIDTNRGLRPLTDYMFKKYVEPILNRH